MAIVPTKPEKPIIYNFAVDKFSQEADAFIRAIDEITDVDVLSKKLNAFSGLVITVTHGIKRPNVKAEKLWFKKINQLRIILPFLTKANKRKQELENHKQFVNMSLLRTIEKMKINVNVKYLSQLLQLAEHFLARFLDYTDENEWTLKFIKAKTTADLTGILREFSEAYRRGSQKDITKPPISADDTRRTR